MRAAFITKHGGPEVLEVGERPEPEPGPGQVRVRIVAAALNHLDLFTRNGIPGVEVAMPHVLGADGAGVVDRVGEGVRSLRPGDEVWIQPGLFCGRCEFCVAGETSMCLDYRLLGEHVDGTFAEYVVVPEENAYPKPADLAWEAAAAFPLVYQTAWRMVVTKGRIGPGHTVLIHGIGGGVALAALQIAVLAGAEVHVTSSSRDKLDRGAELGAAGTILYTEEDVVERIRELTGRRGVDLVVDDVGEATWRTSVECVRRGGRVVTCGGTTGYMAKTPIHRVFWKQISIHGSTMANRAEVAAVARFVESGRIVPVIDRAFSLEAASAALARLEEAEQSGKIVLNVGEA